jgi:hypothetical protein
MDLVSTSGGQVPLERLQQALDEVLAWPSERCQQADEVLTSTWSMASRDPSRFSTASRRVLFVTDERCGSDCELAITYVSSKLPTLIVGANTFGMAEFTVPAGFLLPFSGARVSLATGHSDIYGDSRSFDGYGLDVDVLLADEPSHTAASLEALIASLAR